ncbi:MAG: PorP/SprF family type IX secretion system membrane protein [Flavobacteriales bacterium]
MKSHTFLLALCFGALSIHGISQTDIIYSQTLANPTNLFPELTGWHGGIQMNAGYRNQWPGIATTNVGYAIGVDGYVHSIRSGIGINANHYQVGSAIQNSNYVDLNVAPKIQLGDQLVVSPALSVRIGQISIDWSQFGPSMNPISSSINYLSFGAGVGLIRNQTFILAHTANLNQPNISFFASSESRIPRTYQLLAGRNFMLGSFTLTPSCSYQRMSSFNYLNITFNAQYKSIYAGIRYAYNNAIGVAAGYEIEERLRLSYSYDYYTSILGLSNAGSHELALRIWLFKDKAKKQFVSNLPLM